MDETDKSLQELVIYFNELREIVLFLCVLCSMATMTAIVTACIYWKHVESADIDIEEEDNKLHYRRMEEKADIL